MNTCPYCGGSTKRITCGAPGCQMSLTDARRATSEYREKMVAYRATPKQAARQDEYHASIHAKAMRRGRIMRAVEVASDAAKLAVLTVTGLAVYIIACPPTARAAQIAVPEDATVIPNAELLFLMLVMVGTMLLLVIINMIDARKYGHIDRAKTAARRAQLEAENAEYAAAHGRADGE